MKNKFPLIIFFFLSSCANQPIENLNINAELIKGCWQFFDSDSIYTEMEISDSVYYFVHAPMNIFRAEPSSYSLDSSGLYLKLLYTEGDVWKIYESIMPDSFTLKMSNEDEGQFICKRIYPKMKLSEWKEENKLVYQSAFLEREKKFNK